VNAVETLFLACFAFGALFTLASVVLGAVGGIGHGLFHAAGHDGAAHVGQAVGHGHAHGVGHATGSAHALGAQDQSSALGLHHALHLPHGAQDLPLLNPSSVVGFLTWFGAVGYLLARYAEWAIWWVLLGALLAGAAGWYLIARFLGLVLAGEREMDPADYRLIGTVGRISVPIPTGGTGEVIFSKAGTRRSEAARALGAVPITRGTEVVITRYADGFAIVQPWSEFLAAHDEDAEERQGV
jgi:membrane protein implicated in regulation of membrane protease activity